MIIVIFSTLKYLLICATFCSSALTQSLKLSTFLPIFCLVRQRSSKTLIFAKMMKRVVPILLSLIVVLPACTKKEPTRTSGIDTIDNTVYQTTTYFVYGFSFSQAKLLSNLANPGADIIVYVNKDNFHTGLLYRQITGLHLIQAGEYDDEASAKTAFDNLKSFTVTQWTDMADPIRTTRCGFTRPIMRRTPRSGLSVLLTRKGNLWITGNVLFNGSISPMVPQLALQKNNGTRTFTETDLQH